MNFNVFVALLVLYTLAYAIISLISHFPLG